MGYIKEKMEPKVHRGDVQGRWHKLQQGKCKWGIKNVHREVKHKGRSLCKAVKLLSLEASKTWLDMALGSLS